MSTYNTTTTDLSKFGRREIKMVSKLLNAWMDNGLPMDFNEDEVVPMFNMCSRKVFLTNSDYQVAMLVDDSLESFYSSPYHGLEGFFDDLLEEYPEMHHEDQEWFRDLAKMLERSDELPAIDE